MRSDVDVVSNVIGWLKSRDKMPSSDRAQSGLTGQMGYIVDKTLNVRQEVQQDTVSAHAGTPFKWRIVLLADGAAVLTARRNDDVKDVRIVLEYHDKRSIGL